MTDCNGSPEQILQQGLNVAVVGYCPRPAHSKSHKQKEYKLTLRTLLWELLYYRGVNECMLRSEINK